MVRALHIRILQTVVFSQDIFGGQQRRQQQLLRGAVASRRECSLDMAERLRRRCKPG
ncbi:hypothetical protein [Nodosilinea sp. LEGE 07298]|uniref:hypothetical protein n=1 Tax=Nodosilinea sp. LEGE 07298 TaxID=2777970 RepID=UPI001881C3A1|nr:hypothetical protein [Nodosilinea sp. LEGE 07298]